MWLLRTKHSCLSREARCGQKTPKKNIKFHPNWGKRKEIKNSDQAKALVGTIANQMTDPIKKKRGCRTWLRSS